MWGVNGCWCRGRAVDACQRFSAIMADWDEIIREYLVVEVEVVEVVEVGVEVEVVVIEVVVVVVVAKKQNTNYQYLRIPLDHVCLVMSLGLSNQTQ